MEHSFQSETEVEAAEVRRLRLSRRMQAVTIELCMEWLAIRYEHSGPGSRDREMMRRHVARVCGLTEDDFRKVENGTNQETEEKSNGADRRGIVGFSRGDERSAAD